MNIASMPSLHIFARAYELEECLNVFPCLYAMLVQARGTQPMWQSSGLPDSLYSFVAILFFYCSFSFACH